MKIPLTKREMRTLLSETSEKAKGVSEKRAKRYVVCAAMMNSKGEVLLGVRHWDMFMRMHAIKDKKRLPEWAEEEQGFVDNFNNFMRREEAWNVAVEAGQIRYKLDGLEGVLYSEHLY